MSYHSIFHNGTETIAVTTHISDAAIPQEMRALMLDGAGFEHLKLQTIPTPQPGPYQLLARVDAASICTSILKIIAQGSNHAAIYGWDIARYPLILGDEGSITLVKVGDKLRGRYHVGERYVIQSAVDHAPINHRERYDNNGKGVERLGIGYTLAGHLAEYIIVPEEVLEAQGLIPLPTPSLPFAHASLGEPFDCIISAQEHHMHLIQETPCSPRSVLKGLKANGLVVIIGAGTMGRMHVDLAMSYRPRMIVVADHHDERLAQVKAMFGARADKLGIMLPMVNTTTTSLKAFFETVSGGHGADDVIVTAASAKAVEEAQELSARYGVINMFASLKKGENIVRMDTTIVHYRETNVTGSAGGTPWDLAHALELMATGELNPGAHITRIGDLDHAVEFLQMASARTIDGKAVVYPHRRASEYRVVSSWSPEDEQAYLAETVH